MFYIKVSHEGRPGKLFVDGPEITLEIKEPFSRTSLDIEQARTLLVNEVELQRAKALEVLNNGTSIWLLQPAFTNVSKALEWLHSAFDELELRAKAQEVKLAARQPVRRREVNKQVC